MDTCSVETGLLRKKPCGHPSVTHCINCERLLCSQHAVAQLNEAGKHSGKFLCKECKAAWRDIEKNRPTAPPPKPAAPAKEAAPKPAAAKPAEPKPAETKPAEPKPAGSGGLDFK
jgi:hypothetical protein